MFAWIVCFAILASLAFTFELELSAVSTFARIVIIAIMLTEDAVLIQVVAMLAQQQIRRLTID